jgi:hypothetical protein
MVVRTLLLSGAAIAATCWAIFSPDARDVSLAAPAGAMTGAEAGAAQDPDLPRATVEVPEVGAERGRTIHVAAGGSLQAALNEAAAGDLITLEPGATYRGPFTLPRKDGDAWIVITSATPPDPMTSPGQHVTPLDAARMPKLVAASGAVVRAAAGAHHYHLVGLEIAPAAGVFLKSLVELGADEATVDALPHHIVVDRCYVHGDPAVGGRRGIALNGREMAVVRSYVADFKEIGADSQAIAGWNGTGPFKIADNYLEGAGENVMFGGADPTVPGLVPADIEVIRNHLTKPLAWRVGDPEYAGREWAVKNLFELKNARRVLVDGNLLEYNWTHAQNGFAILFTVRNQDGGAPWSVVEDVTFQNNVVRHVGAGINVLGTDDIHTSQPTRRIAIRNNLFVDVGKPWGPGRLFQLLDGTSDVRIDHNTGLQTDTLIWAGDGDPHRRFVFENNIALHNRYGIIGNDRGPGRPTLDRYFPGAVVRRNAIVGGDAALYPPDNFFPGSLEQVGFVAPRHGNYTLAPSSALKRKAADGHDVGVRPDVLARRGAK